MDFIDCIKYGVIAGVIIIVLQSIIRSGKAEGLKSEAKEKGLFATAADITIPEKLINEFPEAIEIIRSNLNSDEIAHKILDGLVGIQPAIFVATNKRVFRINKAKIKLAQITTPTEVKVFNYSDLSNVVLVKNTLLSSVKIVAKSGHEFEIKIFNADLGELFSEFVKKQLENQIKPINESVDPSKSQMLRIGKNGEDIGEMTVKKVKLLLAAGQLELTDFYWDEQLNEWIQLSSCEEIS